MADAGELKVVVSADIKEFQNGMKQVTSELDNVQKNMSSLQKAGESISSLGGSLSKGLTLPLAAVETAAMAAWKSVDEGMDLIVTKTGATGDALADLQGSFKKVAQTVPASMQEIADAIGEVNTQFGYTGKSLEDTTEYIIKFSKITGMGMTEATQAVAKLMFQFGILQEQDIPMILDTLAVAGQRTGVSINELAATIQRFAPQIQALGLDFQTATMMLATWTQEGFDATKMMSYLTLAQARFAKEGLSLQEGLAKMQKEMRGANDETEKLTIAATYFGTRGGAYMLNAIEKGALNLEDFAEAAEGAAGAVTTTFEDTLDPIDKATVAMNNLKLAGAELGTAMQSALVPIIEKVVELLQNFTSWFIALPDPIKEVIAIVGMLAAALGPVLLIVGQIIKLLPVLGAAFTALTGPIGIVVAAIAGVIAIGTALYTHWDEVKGFLTNIWDAIANTASSIWGGIKNTAITIWQGIGYAIQNPIEVARAGLSAAWDVISSTASSVWAGIKSVATTIWEGIGVAISQPVEVAKAGLSSAWSIISATASSAWDWMKSTATTTWQAISWAIQNPIEATKMFLSNTWAVVSTTLSSVWEGIKATASVIWQGISSVIQVPMEAVKNVLSVMWEEIATTANAVWNGLKNTASVVWQGIGSVIQAPINAVQPVLSTAWSTISNTASNIWNGMKRTATTVWQGIGKAMLDPIDSAKTTLSNVWKSISDTALSAWNGLKTSASDIFKQVVDAIVTPFRNVHIPMPHFSFEIKYANILGLSIPYPDVKVNWYAKGGIFTQPSIIGVGEAGPEAVVPLSQGGLIDYDKMGQAVAKYLKPSVTLETNIYSGQPLSPSEIKRKQEQLLRQLAMEW